MVEKERKRGLPFVGGVVETFHAAFMLSQCNDQDVKDAVKRCNTALSVAPKNETAFSKRKEFMAALKAQSPVFAYDLNAAALAISGLPIGFHVELLHESAKLAQTLNRGGEATKHYKLLLALDPGNEDAVRDYQDHIVNVLRTDARECVEKGRPHAAVSVLARLLEQRPGDEGARNKFCELVVHLENKGDPFSMSKAARAREAFLKFTGESLGAHTPSAPASSAALNTSPAEL